MNHPGPSALMHSRDGAPLDAAAAAAAPPEAAGRCWSDAAGAAAPAAPADKPGMAAASAGWGAASASPAAACAAAAAWRCCWRALNSAVKRLTGMVNHSSCLQPVCKWRCSASMRHERLPAAAAACRRRHQADCRQALRRPIWRSHGVSCIHGSCSPGRRTSVHSIEFQAGSCRRSRPPRDGGRISRLSAGRANVDQLCAGCKSCAPKKLDLVQHGGLLRPFTPLNEPLLPCSPQGKRPIA